MKNRRLLLGILLSVMIIAVGCSQKLDLIGRGLLDSDWMDKTPCYKVSNRLIKKYAKDHDLVYSIPLIAAKEPIRILFWYFDSTKTGENQINIVVVVNAWDTPHTQIYEYKYDYPYSLKWLWDIKDHKWPDSLLITERKNGYHPKDFTQLPGMPEFIFGPETAIVYNSKYHNVFMPTYYLAEKFGSEIDSLSPIYKTYHESFKHFIYPIADSIMGDDITWQGIYADF